MVSRPGIAALEGALAEMGGSGRGWAGTAAMSLGAAWNLDRRAVWFPLTLWLAGREPSWTQGEAVGTSDEPPAGLEAAEHLAEAGVSDAEVRS